MRALMGVIKDRHGTCYARRKVPKGLEEAVARVLPKGKRRQSWLKRSLSTKSLHEANIRAKPVLMEFDGIIERARELLKEKPTRPTLTPAEIKKIAAYHYATVLANDAAARRHARQIIDEFRDEPAPADTPRYGLTEDEFQRRGRAHKQELKTAQAALARGHIAFVEGEVEELLDDIFHIQLDRASASDRSTRHQLSDRVPANTHHTPVVPSPGPGTIASTGRSSFSRFPFPP
jgi:hypothetical protein